MQSPVPALIIFKSYFKRMTLFYNDLGKAYLLSYWWFSHNAKRLPCLNCEIISQKKYNQFQLLF